MTKHVETIIVIALKQGYVDTVRGGPYTISLGTKDPPARDAKLEQEAKLVEEFDLGQTTTSPTTRSPLT